MAPSSSITNLITSTAAGYGVPPEYALAVAQKESSFNPNAVGAAGEIGLFQIMPATGLSLGYTPAQLQDPENNADAGISFLAQLFDEYGSWPAALSAYNSGSPNGSPGYANSVLALAGGIPSADTSDDTSDDSSSSIGGIDPNTLIIAGIVGALGLLWWMEV